ncbi:MAG: DUF881 domain-containing protein [Candidatus Dormibacterales bacterium]
MTTALGVGLLAAALPFLLVVQLRSQAEVARTLAGQDPSELAFLIDHLHRANETLAATEAQLDQQRHQLGVGGGAGAAATLKADVTRLEIVEGTIPVRGPGVSIQVDAPLTATDLQAAVDNLRLGGAEAIAVDGVRVVAGTPVSGTGAHPAAGGLQLAGAPWTFQAIGDPARLVAVAALMTQTLRRDPRVRSVGYTVSESLGIASVIRQHPFVYSS